MKPSQNKKSHKNTKMRNRHCDNYSNKEGQKKKPQEDTADKAHEKTLSTLEIAPRTTYNVRRKAIAQSTEVQSHVMNRDEDENVKQKAKVI
jgi:hypothetical protein